MKIYPKISERKFFRNLFKRKFTQNLYKRICTQNLLKRKFIWNLSNGNYPTVHSSKTKFTKISKFVKKEIYLNAYLSRRKFTWQFICLKGNLPEICLKEIYPTVHLSKQKFTRILSKRKLPIIFPDVHCLKENLPQNYINGNLPKICQKWNWPDFLFV